MILVCYDQSSTRMEIAPGSRCGGFQELGVYDFDPLPDHATLFIDEELVEPVVTPAGPVLRWKPGFYAGEVSAELVASSGALLALYRLDVAPDARKLGADLFQQMLDDIHAFDPALLPGTEAAQFNIGVAGELNSVLLQYARLRRHSDALIKALEAVSARPLSRLQHERKHVPFHQVRRIDARSARQLMSRPDTAAVLRGQPHVGASAPLFNVVQSGENLDNPANRALSATLASVRARCDSVAEGLAKLTASQRDEATRTPLSNRLQRKLEFLQAQSERLCVLSKRSPYANVSRREVVAAGLTAISAHPGYSRAYRLGWSTLRPGITGLDREESLWLSPTWEIYERWCFVRIVESLRTVFPSLQWKCLRRPTVDVIRWVGTGAGVRVEACLQRIAGSPERSSGLRSVSLRLKPDIVVMVEANGLRRLLVLDAKYRTGRANVLDAMRTAHIYQDALRWKGHRPDCTLLLVPQGGDACWLESPAFHQQNRTGVHVLGFEQPAGAIENMLAGWLRD
ncbi:DUF2357 domain-containing protein [Stenotrophomonas sp. Ker107b]